jgi:hypothetical protein
VRRNGGVKVANAFRVSYPGYSEILTGRAQDAVIRGNEKLRNPTPTLLEFVARKFQLSPKQAALFGSWAVFEFIGESKPGAVTINAGYKAMDGTPRMRELSALQFEMLTPWDEVRHDYVTLGLALEWMRAEKPRIIHIALGETDDWAHDRRYDRVLATIQQFDAALKRIWEFVESSPDYRGRTAMVVTTDHGRGSTLADWNGHGPKVAGAEQIWIAAIGPGIPATGETSNSQPLFQRDIAPTVLDAMGIDWREYSGVEGRPIPHLRR